MKSRSLIAALALSVLALPAFAQEPAEKPMPADPDMEAMVKAGTPGEPHRHLAKLAGDWTYTSKMWMDPSQPPEESSGTMQAETILGGRYVQNVWKGNFMGMPFEGRGTEGYDNVTEKLVSSWVDSFSTGIFYSTGTCDADWKVCTSTGEMLDPATNQPMTLRSVTTWTGDDSFKVEMFMKTGAGEEFKHMEMDVRRKTT